MRPPTPDLADKLVAVGWQNTETLSKYIIILSVYKRHRCALLASVIDTPFRVYRKPI